MALRHTFTPPFAIPASRRAWATRRLQIKRQLWDLLGDLPPRPVTPRVRTQSRQRHDGYTLERFTLENGSGVAVPGCLLLPEGATARRPVPAILYHHWHGGEYAIGKEALFQRTHTPVAPGPALARRGYAVLCIDAYGFGERQGRGPGGTRERGLAEELSASKLQLWLGRSLWGMIVRDDVIALDYLASRGDIDARRIGAAGISMGATRTWWLMALDERVAAGVSIACLTRYQNLIAHEALSAHGIYYYVPGMLRHFDTEAVVSTIAPRPALFLNGDRDAGSPADGIRAIASVARRVYRLYDRPRHFHSRIYPGVGHACTNDMWARTMSWLERFV
ncbi:MAG: alpha/beta hydrolase family protein [Acidobacteriota bacterium]